jgi:hypothetical protein
MAKLGGFCKLPFPLGGDPSPSAKIYNALKGTLVGEGVAPADDYEVTTFDGLWRAAKAQGLAALQAVDEAAHWQGFPSTVTDEIRSYEEILGVAPSELSENERRQRVVELWTLKSKGDYITIGLKLEALDSRFSMVIPDRDDAGTVVPGKALDAADTPDAAGNYAGSRTCTLWPNFSDDYVVRVLLDVGAGVPPTGSIGELYAQAFTILDDSLPAWNDFQIQFETGFSLGLSLLDLTGLTE